MEKVLETYQHKVAAVFANEIDAFNARGSLLAEGYSAEQLSVIGPDSANPDSQIEPEGHEVAKSVVKDAAIGSVIGGAAGAVGTALLAAASVPLLVSPIIATAFMVGWGASVGAFAGAGIGVGMDEDQFAGFVKDAAHDGHWVLVIQTKSEADTKRTLEYIKQMSERTEDVASV